jgi:hypothetical protein
MLLTLNKNGKGIGVKMSIAKNRLHKSKGAKTRRTVASLCALAVLSISAACEHATTDNSNATRNSAVETNANLNNNLNANTASANVGVVTNDNGNQNTAGISTINSNNAGNKNGNSNAKPTP